MCSQWWKVKFGQTEFCGVIFKGFSMHLIFFCILTFMLLDWPKRLTNCTSKDCSIVLSLLSYKFRGCVLLFVALSSIDVDTEHSGRKSGHVLLFGARLQRVKAMMVCEPIDRARYGGRVTYTSTRRLCLAAAPGDALSPYYMQLCTCLIWHTFPSLLGEVGTYSYVNIYTCGADVI